MTDDTKAAPREPGDWDLESVYDEKISPLMTQIIAIAKEHQIPMVASFQFQDTPDDGPGFCTTAILPREWLPDERLCDAMRALRSSGHVALAETHVTNPDGSKTISVRRIS